ncbi:MAG: hypothetical protein ACYC44_03715 [Patescibacteria group bacterium]
MLNKRIKFYLVVLTLLANSLYSGGQVLAQTSATATDPGFDPNSILTDDDMFDVYGMGYDYLKHFLQSKGALADIKVKDIDGIDKPAVDIIWRVAQSYKLNPKYLIALLQKEQSLVEDSSPSQRQLDWAAGYAVCDSCSKDDPLIQQYKGFANQMEYAAKQHREKYLMQLLTFGATISGKAVGKAMNVDGQVVIPSNNATAMLYTYTPHLHGNYNLWKIWKRWFSLTYPNGTIVRGLPSDKAYLIQGGQKREFATESVLLSMADPKKILEASDTDLSAYPDGEQVKFPKYSIIRTEKENLYLITSSGKRLIASQKAFKKFGFIEDDVIDATEQDVKDLAVLDPITETTSFPQGALLKAAKSSTVWYVENSVKHAIPDMVFIKLYFPGRPIKSVAAKTLDNYTLGDPYQLQAGELVRAKSTPDVYVVEDNKLRPIPSAEIFELMGYKWQNVVMIPDHVLQAYEIGLPLTPTSQPSTPAQLTANQ